MLGTRIEKMFTSNEQGFVGIGETLCEHDSGNYLKLIFVNLERVPEITFIGFINTFGDYEKHIECATNYLIWEIKDICGKWRVHDQTHSKFHFAQRTCSNIIRKYQYIFQ